MKMTLKEYQNKVKGCWMGKNIGGTLGAPFECARGVLDVDFYTQDMSDGAWPNDDLDLQLAWLCAAERYGRNVNAQILGEYWVNYIVANWSEYGAGKNNLRNGIIPPLSGSYNNVNKNSCGAFIRSEIWACLMPGHPELAVKYAFEDSSVDHSDEGVYAEIFCAAVQSAAFAVSDMNELINIGLSYIPEDCGVAVGIKTVLECKNNGLDWKEARKKVLQSVPGIFGMYRGYCYSEPEDDIPIGEPGYDAPSNVAIAVLGWVYGEGDFGKSICIATNCCEDSDCTAATLGALLGIILGYDNLPEKWIEPIGEGIKNVALNTVEGLHIPSTITDLSDRVCNLMPTFMGAQCDIINENGVCINLREGKDLYDNYRLDKGRFKTFCFKDFLADHSKSIFVSGVGTNLKLVFSEGIDIKNETPLKCRLEIENLFGRQQWLKFRWFIPETWNVSTGKEFSINVDYFAGQARVKIDFEILPQNIEKPEYELVLEMKSEGRPTKLFIPIKLINSPNNERMSVDILK